MNQQMWKAAATQANLQTLSSRGVHILGPAAGEQACGDVGVGRMLEPEDITDCLSVAELPTLFQDKHILITAGPTREAIDPVRYITNHSSGKMGYAIAAAARKMGANVTLVSGPTNLPIPNGVNGIAVESAADMYQAVMDKVSHCDIFIGCAAVADYRPVQKTQQKIKKTEEELTLTFTKNPDILADVAKLQQATFTVGFAAETQDVARYAKQKLEKKNLNMIAANDVSQQGLGFNSDKNALTIYWNGGEKSLNVADKGILAEQLLAVVAQRYDV
jgi:phosphopantothenoylcysteine decarboxylase/phosphopantothenate--cysteine ligase